MLLIPCFLGGLVGAILLVKTSNLEFEHVVAYFMALAVILLIFQSHIHKWLYTSKGINLRRRHHIIVLTIVSLVFFIVSLYGGYFGAGFGIIILAFLGLTQIYDIQRMNGLKNLAGVSVGIADCTYFIMHGLIDWKIFVFFGVGCLVGGYFGATYSSKLPTKTLKERNYLNWRDYHNSFILQI